MTQALYRKWRPRTFDEVVGQEHITSTLRNALTTGRVGHAYLFSGLRGTGKTTMARLVAKAVNCLAEDPADRPCNECSVCQAVNEGRFLDLIEIDAASHTGVDDVRELRDKVGFRPNEGRYKVYIIDEVHRFSGSAFDALLKTIEEPPDHAIFILATTEIHKVPATILSRCQRFDFRRISMQLIVQRLKMLADAEGISVEPEALALIARSATGSMRDAESLLDQLAAANLDGVTAAQVQTTLGTIGAELVASLVDSLVACDVASGLAVIDQALDRGADLRQFTRQVVNHLRDVLLVQLEGSDLLDLSAESIKIVTVQAERISTSALVYAIKRFSQAEAELRGGWQPQLPLELALVEAIQGPARELAQPTLEAAEATMAGGQLPQPEVDPEPASTRAESEPTLTAQPGPVSRKSDEAATSGGLTLRTVQHFWSQVVENVRARDKSVQALLNSTRPIDVQQETVILQVAHEFGRSKLSQGRAKRLVEEVMSQLFDESCHVEYRVIASEDESLDKEEVVVEGDDRGDLGDTWADDPVVQAARQMGAEVRPIDEGEKRD